MIQKAFSGKGLKRTVKQVMLACDLCAHNNTGPSNTSFITQARGTYPGEDWQLDFTQMPPISGHKYLLVFVDTFTEWVEAFPT